MKKYCFPVITSLIIGIVMAFLLINSYDAKSKLIISKKTWSVFYIEKGVYSSKENMEENMMDFENYIYNVEEGKYHTYIGITQNRENAIKIQKYYKNYKTNIKEKATNKKHFIIILKQYDDILSKTNDDETIKTICNQILSKYEELIKNEY